MDDAHLIQLNDADEVLYVSCGENFAPPVTVAPPHTGTVTTALTLAAATFAFGSAGSVNLGEAGGLAAVSPPAPAPAAAPAPAPASASVKGGAGAKVREQQAAAERSAARTAERFAEIDRERERRERAAAEARLVARLERAAAGVAEPALNCQLRALQQRKGYTQAQIGLLLGISGSGVSNWLNGVRMTPDAVAALDARVAALLVAEAAETGTAVGESGAPTSSSGDEAAGWAELQQEQQQQQQQQRRAAPGAAETRFAAAGSKPAVAKRRRAEASTGSDGEEGDEESSEDEWSEGESDEGEDGADGPAAGEENDVYVVERILERRHFDQDRILYRIRWLGFGVKDDTWEPRANIAPALVRAFNAKLGYKSDDEDDEDDGEEGEEDEEDGGGAGQQLPTTPPPQQRQQQQRAPGDPSDTPPGAPRAAAAFVLGADDVNGVQEGALAGADGPEPARSEDGAGREVLRLLAEQDQPQPQTQPQPPQLQPCEQKARRGAKAPRCLLAVGDAIEAKYGGIKSTGAWFPGTVVAVSHDGGVLEGSLTYSIDYDDGDQERGVLPRFVRPLKADGAVAGEATHTPLLPGPPAMGQAVGGAVGAAVRIAYCSMRHAMRLRPAPRGELGGELTCDGCQASIAAAARYSCGRCDFDYCAACGEARSTPATAAEKAADKRTLDEADFPDAKRLALDSPAAVPEVVD